MTARAFDISCDVGGSFVDFIAHGPGVETILLKRARGPGVGPATLLDALLHQAGIAPHEVARLRLSTTLATNALASGTATPVALLATRGFTDVPDLGRQSRRDPDALNPPPPTPAWLSPRDWRLPIAGRIDARGVEVEPLDQADISAALARLATLPEGAPVAICLLFAPLNPSHEQALNTAILAARPDLRISLSYQVDPTLREFERMLATLADASLKPLLAHAFSGFIGAPWLLRAEGVLAPMAEALDRPLGLAVSGPAAAALAVSHWAEGDAIGLDMGGTTTEISLIRDGAPLMAREIGIGDLRLRCPALDVESIALGGSSSLFVEGGRIRFGPVAEPACRGGSAPTLTDAALAAGWLPSEVSHLALDVVAARAALRRVLGSDDATTALELAEAMIAEQARRIALRRGLDPVRAILVAGGGFGPLHAAAIAERMGGGRVLIPSAPGLLSASGLAMAQAGASMEQPCDLAVEALDELRGMAAAQASILAHRVKAAPLHHLEIAYAGQSETLAIAWTPGEAPALIAARFDAEHAARRGHAPGGARRIFALRSTASAPLGATPRNLPVMPAAQREGATRRTAFRTPANGPLLLDGGDATIRVPSGWRASPRDDGALLLERL